MSDLSSELNPDRATVDLAASPDIAEPSRTHVVDAGLGDAELIGAELAGVDRALARIEAGEYGDCTDCGARLDDALLASDPTATTCPAHLELEHVSEPVAAEGPPAVTPGASWSSDR